VYSNLTEKW